MSVKIKKTLMILAGIVTFPLIISILDYMIKFIMQLGRITGTMVRIIMDL